MSALDRPLAKADERHFIVSQTFIELRLLLDFIGSRSLQLTF